MYYEKRYGALPTGGPSREGGRYIHRKFKTQTAIQDAFG
jgi:hypothetical protein